MEFIQTPFNLLDFTFWLGFYIEKIKHVVSALKSFFGEYPQFFIYTLGLAFAFGFIAWLIKSIKF